MGAERSVVVDTQSGRIEGERRGGHSVFRGIPFAQAPVGALRFRPPTARESWSGVRPAVRFGPSAPQGLSFAPGSAAEGPSSEDCLYLNVYTPAVDGRKRPVMFWIHGGAFTVGSASAPLYDGGPLAELGDVVVVTVNYRLGALGFLALGEAGAGWDGTANLGILDQIAALRWVRDNIEGFGGDPGSVTLFGESAGATCVAILLTARSAEDLFHRAIAQSPSESLTLLESAHAGRTAEAFLRALGIAKTDARLLEDVPLAEILKAQASLETGADYWRGFAPVRDRTTLPEHPRDVLARGEGARVPLIIGTNRDEWNLFALATVADWNDPMDDGAAVEDLLARGVARGPALGAEHLLRTYRESRSQRGLPHDNRALVRAIEGDRRFRMPSLAFAERYRTRGVPVFEYLFTHESPALKGLLGACHALELAFVFGTLEAPQQDRFAGKGPAVEGLSRAMMRAWLAFARGSDPNADGSRVWRPYDAETRTTMIFNTTATVPEDAPFEEERLAWSALED
jgi:para-nitrobenzyl esterase